MTAAQSNKRKQWVAVAEKLVYSSAATVECPECGQTSLNVRDVEYGWGEGKGLERYMVCSKCKAYSSVNMRRAGEYHAKKSFAATG